MHSIYGEAAKRSNVFTRFMMNKQRNADKNGFVTLVTTYGRTIKRNLHTDGSRNNLLRGYHAGCASYDS